MIRWNLWARDRKIAQDALQTYSHAMNHDLRNWVIGISTLVQGVLFRSSLVYTTAIAPELAQSCAAIVGP